MAKRQGRKAMGPSSEKELIESYDHSDNGAENDRPMGLMPTTAGPAEARRPIETTRPGMTHERCR